MGRRELLGEEYKRIPSLDRPPPSPRSQGPRRRRTEPIQRSQSRILGSSFRRVQIIEEEELFSSFHCQL